MLSAALKYGHHHGDKNTYCWLSNGQRAKFDTYQRLGLQNSTVLLRAMEQVMFTLKGCLSKKKGLNTCNLYLPSLA